MKTTLVSLKKFSVDELIHILQILHAECLEQQRSPEVNLNLVLETKEIVKNVEAEILSRTTK